MDFKMHWKQQYNQVLCVSFFDCICNIIFDWWAYCIIWTYTLVISSYFNKLINLIDVQDLFFYVLLRLLQMQQVIEKKGACLCLGCRRYFQQGQSLQLESLTVQFKNYQFPMKESKQKWGLLKTICGFLNTKGGTIYIGVEDNNSQVRGLTITRKEQDQYKLALKQLVERIDPIVDFMDKEEIQVFYVPVVKNKVFLGKSIIKIVVKQGDPGKLYCFTQKITLQYDKNQEYDILYSYLRHNMAGIEELKGIKVVMAAQKKAASPNAIANTFHEECNPEPLSLQFQVTKLAFGGFEKKAIRLNFQKIFDNQLAQMEIDYQLTYDLDNKVVLIQFDTPKQYQMANQFVISNLPLLNRQYQNLEFVNQGIVLDYNLYQNIKAPLPQNLSVPSVLEVVKTQNQNQINISNHNQENQISNKNEDFSVIFTSVNPKLIKQLIQYLSELPQQGKIIEKVYENSVERYFQTEKEQITFYGVCQAKTKQLNAFGVNGDIKFGYGTAKVHILYYDKDRRKALTDYLQKTIQNDLLDTNYKVQNGRHFLQIKLKSKSLACKWLDILLNNNQLKDQFQMPGKYGKQKMKIYLHCLGDRY